MNVFGLSRIFEILYVLSSFMKPLFFISAFLLTVFLVPNAFAETFEIKIPPGASDTNSGIFWHEDSTGETTGTITINIGDTVKWYNTDNAFHSIVSISYDFEEDGLFNSSLFSPGKTFKYTFNEAGDYYYYCDIHPFMKGIVHVEDKESLKLLSNVASEYTSESSLIDIKYYLDVNLSDSVFIDPQNNLISFSLEEFSNDSEVVLILPTSLIKSIKTVLVNDEIVDYILEENLEFSKVTIPINSESKLITISGTYVIPEFGSLSIIVMLFSFIFIVLFSVKGKLRLNGLSQ